jgi:hypothetical protein
MVVVSLIIRQKFRLTETEKPDLANVSKFMSANLRLGQDLATIVYLDGPLF